MAEILRIVMERPEGGSETIDLLSGALHLEMDGWEMLEPEMRRPRPFGGPPLPYEPIRERFILIGEGDREQIRARIRQIDRALELLRQRRSDNWNQWQIWLEAWTEGEGDDGLDPPTPFPRRAYLIDGSAARFPARQGTFSPLLHRQAERMILILARMPFWESYAQQQVYNPSQANAPYNPGPSLWGGMHNLSTIPGTAPARIERIRMINDESNTGNLNELWCGIWTDHTRTSPNFDPILELENGAPGTDTASQASSTASGGYAMRTDFATTTSEAMRVQFRISQAAGDTAAYFGRYLLLLRARCSDSATQAVARMRYGDLNSSSRIYGSYVEISGVDWRLYEMGEIGLPPGRIPLSSYDPSQVAIELLAERTAGSGALEWDAILMMPSQHMIHLWDLDLRPRGGGYAPSATVETLPDGSTTARHIRGPAGSSAPDYATALDARQWWLPTEHSLKLVFAGQRAGLHDLNDAIDLEFFYRHRWRSYKDPNYP